MACPNMGQTLDLSIASAQPCSEGMTGTPMTTTSASRLVVAGAGRIVDLTHASVDSSARLARAPSPTPPIGCGAAIPGSPTYNDARAAPEPEATLRAITRPSDPMQDSVSRTPPIRAPLGVCVRVSVTLMPRFTSDRPSGLSRSAYPAARPPSPRARMPCEALSVSSPSIQIEKSDGPAAVCETTSTKTSDFTSSSLSFTRNELLDTSPWRC